MYNLEGKTGEIRVEGGESGVFIIEIWMMTKLTIRQSNGAFLRIDREQTSLIPNVSFRDQTDL